MFGGMKDVYIDGMSDIQEVQVFGEIVYLCNVLCIVVMMLDGKVVWCLGQMLMILCKEVDGKWWVVWDVNLVMVDLIN